MPLTCGFYGNTLQPPPSLWYTHLEISRVDPPSTPFIVLPPFSILSFPPSAFPFPPSPFSCWSHNLSPFLVQNSVQISAHCPVHSPVHESSFYKNPQVKVRKDTKEQGRKGEGRGMKKERGGMAEKGDWCMLEIGNLPVSASVQVAIKLISGVHSGVSDCMVFISTAFHLIKFHQWGKMPWAFSEMRVCSKIWMLFAEVTIHCVLN